MLPVSHPVTEKVASFLRFLSLTKLVKPSRIPMTRIVLGSTTLIVAVAAYFSHQVLRNAILENLKENAFLKVNVGADEIDKWIALRKSETEAIANLPMNKTMNWSAIAPDFQAEYERINSFEPLLGIVNSQGEFFNILKGQTNVNVKDRPTFTRGMAGLSTVMDPILSRITGKPIIVFGAPIWSGSVKDPTRKPIGIVNAPISIEKVTEIIQQLKYGSNSYAFALNSQGEAITHPDTTLMSNLDKPASSLIKISDQGLAKIAQSMVNRQKGIEKVTINGVENYVAFLPLQEANWSVALVIPRENIESQLFLLDGIAFLVLLLAGTMISVLVYVNVWEQAQLEKSKLLADSANQAKSDFLANMSHELRTPLNGILGYAQILSRSKALPEKERNGVGIIYQCGSHLLTLINDILDISKIEARKLDFVPNAIHLPSFLQGVVEICRVRADEKDIDFIYQPAPNLPEGIEADEKRLRQVLINLLGNAIKFTDNGSVTLKLEVLEPEANIPIPRLKFQIEDTGVGIAADQVSRIFQAFEQVGDQKRQAEGTGLGLAISQKIVQLMGSKIQVESQLGVGSKFSFDVALPITTNWAKQNSVSHGQTIIGYAGSPKHILIVDDRWENRSVLINLLEPLGFIFTEAENGQEGLEKAREKSPDLVITDLAMPVMDGFTFMKQLRSDPELKNLLVIVSSASVAEIDQQMSLDAGGDDFLAKPVEAEELFTLVAKYLQLTWKYDEATPEVIPVTRNKPAEPVELVPPPVMDLQVLLELAKDGMLDELTETAEKIGKKDDRYQPFVEQILQLAKQFQVEKIETLIEKYLIHNQINN